MKFSLSIHPIAGEREQNLATPYFTETHVMQPGRGAGRLPCTQLVTKIRIGHRDFPLAG